MTTALAVIETINAVDLFNPEIIQPKLEAIRAQVIAEAATLDISTPGNRAAIASLAYKVGQSKTFVDKQRLALVADEKKRLKKIDQVGGEVWDYLETLQKEVRKPLTDWENADKERIAAHEANLKEIENAGALAMQTWNAYSAEAMRDRMKEIETEGRDWEEFSSRAHQTITLALKQMAEALAKREAYEAEQAELVRLRAEAAEREQKELEERIAREATERAEAAWRQREEQAARAAAEAAARHQREQEAARARIAKAEQDAEDAAEQAEREKLAAVEAERCRQEQNKARAEAEQKAREKDFAHKAAVNSAAMKAFGEIGIDVETAKKIVKAIAKGSIPAVRIVY